MNAWKLNVNSRFKCFGKASQAHEFTETMALTCLCNHPQYCSPDHAVTHRVHKWSVSKKKKFIFIVCCPFWQRNKYLLLFTSKYLFLCLNRCHGTPSFTGRQLFMLASRWRLDPYFLQMKYSWHITVRQKIILPNSGKSTLLSWFASSSLKMRSTADLSLAFCRREKSEQSCRLATHSCQTYTWFHFVGGYFKAVSCSLILSITLTHCVTGRVHNKKAPRAFAILHTTHHNACVQVAIVHPVGCAGLSQRERSEVTHPQQFSKFILKQIF